MGTLFDRFHGNVYANEADVVARFLLPLLTELLGYQAKEVVPEQNIPALSVPLNRRSSATSRDLLARPDIVLTVDDGATYAGACDAKHPAEDVSKHLDQLRAYANALETTNLLLITNGTATYLFHGNIPLLEAKSVEELDLHFDRLLHVFGRERVARLSEHDRVVTLGTLAPANDDPDESERRHRVDVSDFREYLGKLIGQADDVALPLTLRRALGDTIVRVSPGELHRFHQFEEPSKPSLTYEHVLSNPDHTRILLIGESGMGKSILLQQYCADQAVRCLKGSTNVIPVPVRLASCSSARTIESLTLDQLASHGASTTLERLRQLMSQGRLVLVLDGLDEALDVARPVVQRDLDHLARTFPRLRLVVSTRPKWTPNGQSFLRYNLAPLTDDQVRRFLARQTGLVPSEILGRLRTLHVDALATNTLLLSLICALLKQHTKLPRTKNSLLSEVVRVVERYEDEKPDRGGLGLPWREKRVALSRLALVAMKGGGTYSVSSDQAAVVLTETLQDLERRRSVRAGVRMTDLEDELVATGFVARFDEGYVFWHRAFAEHFAVAALIEALQNGQAHLAALARDRRWSEVLPAAVAGSPSSEALLRELASLNVFAAGAALAEAEHFSAAVAESVVARLSACCRSVHGPIRGLATTALSHIPSPAVEETAHELLESSPLGVQFWALLELARRNPTRAGPLVEERLDWDDFDDDGFRHASEVVAQALGEIGNPWAQGELLTRWRSRDERWFGAPIARAFTRLAHRGALTPAIAADLLSWFCSDDISYQTAADLAEVLVALNTRIVAQELGARIRRGWDHQKDQSHASAHVKALESLTHESASDVILLGIEDEALPLTIRERFAQALSFSRARIDVERVRALAYGGDRFIRACALDRLSTFGWQSVEREVRLALSDCQHMRDALPDADRLQSRCILVLGRHHQLRLLAEPELRQEIWFRTSLFNLLNALVEHPSSDLVSLLQRFLGVDDSLLRARLAVALAAAGELRLAKEVRDELLARPRAEYTESSLLEGLEFLPRDAALEWAQYTWNASREARAAMSGFMLDTYLETLEQIGSPEARDEMMRVIENVSSRYELASALSHLRQLTTVDLQARLIELARKHEANTSVQGWCMALIGLGGDLTSEAFVSEGLKHRDAGVRTSAFRALMRLHERQGRLWYGTEQL